MKPGAPFDGDPILFPSWRATMEHRLEADGKFIGGEVAKFVYVHENLSPSVQRKVAIWYQMGGRDGKKDSKAFLEYIATLFQDPHRKETARTQLQFCQQKNEEDFETFY